MAKKLHKGVVYSKTKEGRLSQLYYFAGSKRVYVTAEEAEKIKADQAADDTPAETPENTEE